MNEHDQPSTGRTSESAHHPPSATLQVLGAATCEDTAIVRSRLDALGVSYRYRDVDLDPAALDRVLGLNDGHRITPTVVAGDESVAEPTLERLGELFERVAIEADAPQPVQLHGDITAWPVPYRHLLAGTGSSFHLGSLRGRRQVCLFLAHEPDCLACFGYARQLARHDAALTTADATLIIAPLATPAALDEWRQGLPPGVTLLADADGGWHTALGTHLGFATGAVSVVLLDRFLAPRVVASAAEAGGLPDPTDLIGWLDHLTLECPECSGELPWPSA